MDVQLYKKVGKYTDKTTGKEKPFTNFYAMCGDTLVPVEVSFFPQEKFDGRDPNYQGRKLVLSSFASPLPDKTDSGEHSPQATSSRGNPPITDQPQPVDSEGLSF